MPYPLSCPIDDIQTEALHSASMAVMARTGIRFQSAQAVDLFRHHGFKVDGDIVFFDEDRIRRALETIPAEITIRARNPDHNLVLNTDCTSFGIGRGAVTFVAPDGQARPGTRADYINVAKLAQELDVIEHWGPLIHPGDVPAADAELWMAKTQVAYLDKPYYYASARHIELIARAFGLTSQEMAQKSRSGQSFGQSSVNILSPLCLTAEAVDQLFTFVEHGIVFHLAAMPIAGTTGPCSLAGLIVQQNCENLAPMVLAQLLRPGAPVFYGAIGSHADMVGMGPVFGSAEARLLELAGGQMAKFYGLICRGNAGLTDALGEDFQAGAEALLHMLNVCQGNLNFLPGCGLLGSYMGASLAKVVLDAELIQYARRYLQPLDLDEDHLALDVIDSVGPGGEFVTHDHTLAHCRSAFGPSAVFNRRSYSDAAGEKPQNLIRRAHARAQAIIADYQKPELDPAIARAMDAYVNAQRRN